MRPADCSCTCFSISHFTSCPNKLVAQWWFLHSNQSATGWIRRDTNNKKNHQRSIIIYIETITMASFGIWYQENYKSTVSFKVYIKTYSGWSIAEWNRYNNVNIRCDNFVSRYLTTHVRYMYVLKNKVVNIIILLL